MLIEMRFAAVFAVAVLVGCGPGERTGHRLTVSTPLPLDQLMDQGSVEFPVFDAVGYVGTTEAIQMTGEGSVELLIHTERQDYEAESWIACAANLRTDGSIFITPVAGAIGSSD